MRILLFLLLFAFKANAQHTVIQNDSNDYWDITVICEGQLIFTDIMSPGDLFSWVGYGRKVKIVHKQLTNKCGKHPSKSVVFYGIEAGFRKTEHGTMIFRIMDTPCSP